MLHAVDAAGNPTGVTRRLEFGAAASVPPELDDFKPTGKPEASAEQGDGVGQRYVGGQHYERETNTMPQWAGSCWYFLRFIDPKNPTAFVDPAKLKYWMPVDLYVGGAEHAVLHLLYSRFWHKVLFDRGCVSTPEPFQRLVNQGMILGEYEYHISPESFAANKDALAAASVEAVHVPKKDDDDKETYVLRVKDTHGALVSLPDELVEKKQGKTWLKGTGIELMGRADKMSKSRGNVVNPDDIIREYGADSLRLYEMFMGPLEAVKPWSTKSVEGVYRFLSRAWRLIVDEGERFQLHPAVKEAQPDRDTLRVLHRTIQKVTRRHRIAALQHRHLGDDGVRQPHDEAGGPAARGPVPVCIAACTVCAACRGGNVAGSRQHDQPGLRTVAGLRSNPHPSR